MSSSSGTQERSAVLTASRARGELFIVSAPSGAGKTTLIRRLFEHHPEVASSTVFSVSHTTRRPRVGEVDGQDYFFVSRRRFEEMIGAERFLEWAVVHGRHYGTGRETVERELERGHDVVLDIDVQGARQVRGSYPRAITIFILPPSFEVLESRLRGRESDRSVEIERRLRNALEEIQEQDLYDYVIVNGDLSRAGEALAAVFIARRSRRRRMRLQIEQILGSFPGRQETSNGI